MKRIRKADGIILFFVILILVILWLCIPKNSQRPLKAEIYEQSTLVKTIVLRPGNEETFSIPGKENVVFHLHPDASICFESSDCPDKVCVRTGKLNREGQTAACLPNQLLIKIVADDSSGNTPDAVAGR